MELALYGWLRLSYQRMFDDSPCSLFVQAHVLSRLRRSSFSLFDLVEVLADSCKLLEDCMLFRRNAVQAQVCYHGQMMENGVPTERCVQKMSDSIA